MKRFWVLLCSIGLLFLLYACGGKEGSAEDLGYRFINELYTIDEPDADMSVEDLIAYQNSFSSYFTEKEFEDLEKIRFFLIPQELATRLNNKISVQDIIIEKSDGGKNYEHSFTLVFTDQDGNKVDEEEMKGQMTIIETKQGLKIDRYYDAAEKTLVNK